jgi:hypothetical protein
LFFCVCVILVVIEISNLTIDSWPCICYVGWLRRNTTGYVLPVLSWGSIPARIHLCLEWCI